MNMVDTGEKEKKRRCKAVQSNLQHCSVDFLLLAVDFIADFFDSNLFALHVLPLDVSLLQQAL